MVNHPMRGRRMQLGATVLKVPAPEDISMLVTHIARLWAELHEADSELALMVARSLPSMEITRSE